MGIKGLMTYCRENISECSERVDLIRLARQRGGIVILVDYYAFEYMMMGYFWTSMTRFSGNDYLPFDGGEYTSLDAYLSKFVTDMKHVGIELEFFVDGAPISATANLKFANWKKRHAYKVKRLNQIVEMSKGRRSARSITCDVRLTPVLLEVQILAILKSCGCRIHQIALGEADCVIAKKLNSNAKALAVLTDDSDFLCFPGSRMIYKDDFDIQHNLKLGRAQPLPVRPSTLICNVLEAEKVAACLQLTNSSQMTELSILAGNDFTSPLLSWGILDGLRLPRRDKIPALAQWIREHRVVENYPPFKREMDRKRAFKEAVQHSRKFYSLTLEEDNRSNDRRSEDQPSEDHRSEDQRSEDQSSEDQPYEDHHPEDQPSEDHRSEDQRPEDQRSEDHRPEDRRSENRRSEDHRPEDRRSEDRRPEDQRSEDHHSEDHRSEDHRSEDHRPEEPLFNLLQDGIEAGEFHPDDIMEMHRGIFWRKLMHEDCGADHPSSEEAMVGLRSFIYRLLLPGEKDIVIEHGRSKDAPYEAVEIHASRENLRSLTLHQPEDLEDNLQQFHHIMSHLENGDFQRTWFDRYGTKEGFICYILRYFLVLNWNNNLHVSQSEFLALVAMVYGPRDEKSYQNFAIRPSIRCITLGNWFQNVYRHAYLFLGKLLHLTHEFPLPKEIFSGSVWTAFYTCSSEEEEDDRLRQVDRDTMMQCRRDMDAIIREKRHVIRCLTQHIFPVDDRTRLE